MFSSVFGKTVWEQRRSIMWWILGLVALTVLTVGVYPSIRDQPGLSDIADDYPDALLALLGIEPGEDLFSPSGYIETQLYANWIPLVFLIFSIGTGARAIAGEEEKGTMDSLLANPIARSRIVIEKFWAMVLWTSSLAVGLFAVIFVGNYAVDLKLKPEGVLSINLALLLLAVLFGAIALAIGAVTGRRTFTLGVTSALAVFTYFLFGLAQVVSWLEPFRFLSPFHYFLSPNHLLGGFAWGTQALFIVLIGVAVVVAVWGFNRRDVTS
jgi:ABC-2 type transport system permease protein